MRTLTLSVDGMRCRRCVRQATALVRDVAGVQAVLAVGVPTASHLRGTIDEYVQTNASVEEAASLRDFADKPLVVLTAGTGSAVDWSAKQEALATLSTDSVHRVIGNRPRGHDRRRDGRSSHHTSDRSLTSSPRSRPHDRWQGERGHLGSTMSRPAQERGTRSVRQPEPHQFVGDGTPTEIGKAFWGARPRGVAEVAEEHVRVGRCATSVPNRSA
jgi:copper chaperone CopZ